MYFNLAMDLRRWRALVAVVGVVVCLAASFVGAGTSFVTAVGLEGLVERPGELFDLEGMTVRFTPAGEGKYSVETVRECKPTVCTRRLALAKSAGIWVAQGWAVPLPFEFPFGGKSWSKVFVNGNGNVSFEQCEGRYWSSRDPWANGGMLSMAFAIDGRCAARQEQMIAALWATYENGDPSQVSVDVQKDCLTVDWNMTRIAWGQVVAGPNHFQARLHASGVIELVYVKIADRDGIVGVFPGVGEPGKALFHWVCTKESPDPAIAIDSTDVFDCGSCLDFAFTMKEDVLAKAADPSLAYRCILLHDGKARPVTLKPGAGGPQASWAAVESSPAITGWKMSGKRVELFVSKASLAGISRMSAAWRVELGDKVMASGRKLDTFDVSTMGAGTVKFSALNGASVKEAVAGNVFQVFHHPLVTKDTDRLLRQIYQKQPMTDEIAICWTDFRMDDLYGQGGGAIAQNVAIGGIGEPMAHPRAGPTGSKVLQFNINSVWIGGPIFDESGVEDGAPWHDYGHGVKWLAHECTHRYGMGLRFINPMTGKEEKLCDEHGHWRDGLDTTTRFAVGDLYLGQPPASSSIMAGGSFTANKDGSYTRSAYPFGVAGGLSALDLYCMGMLPPEKVPDTFLLEDLHSAPAGKLRGTRVPVRIGDIVKAMGARTPAFAEAQHTFKMRFYVMHPPDREVLPEAMARAEKLSAAMVEFFTRATGGVMKIVPSGS